MLLGALAALGPLAGAQRGPVNFLLMFFLWYLCRLATPKTAYIFPRQPSPTGYPNTYQLYTMENTRQTILNDYITSQQMQVIPRADVARVLSPREHQIPIPYHPGPRGKGFVSVSVCVFVCVCV